MPESAGRIGPIVRPPQTLDTAESQRQRAVTLVKPSAIMLLRALIIGAVAVFFMALVVTSAVLGGGAVPVKTAFQISGLHQIVDQCFKVPIEAVGLMKPVV